MSNREPSSLELYCIKQVEIINKQQEQIRILTVENETLKSVINQMKGKGEQC